jgi:predicted nucleic acid-binding protein
MILVDTNVPLRIAQPGHPHREAALRALEVLVTRDKEQLGIAPQSLYEMYVVFTRPQNVNGFGYTPTRAVAEIGAVKSLFQLLPESPQAYPTWEALVAKYAVSGKHAHDMRLVAFMISHRIPKLLTFNAADFQRITEIGISDPHDIVLQ